MRSFATLSSIEALSPTVGAYTNWEWPMGAGLGATPTALANMTSIGDKYGYSQKAFLVVPLVAAFLLDVFTMPCIILFINILG